MVVDVMPPLSHSDAPQNPISQKQLAVWMRIPESTLSEAINEAKETKLVSVKNGCITVVKSLKAKDRGLDVNSDIPNLDSPYLRFQEAYRAAHPEFAEALAEKDKLIDELSTEVSRVRKEKRMLLLPELAAWRDEQRKTVDVNSDIPNPNPDANSDSNMDAIRDSTPEIRDVRTDAKARQDDLNPTGVKVVRSHHKDSTSGASSSSSTVENATTTEITSESQPAALNSERLAGPVPLAINIQPIERESAIEAAIPLKLCDLKREAVTPALIVQIDKHLLGAPVHLLAERIALEWKKDMWRRGNGLGIIVTWAGDIGRVWKLGEAERAAAAEREAADELAYEERRRELEATADLPIPKGRTRGAS
jgi:hypothetical protein